jgi:putative oxidoreductase
MLSFLSKYADFGLLVGRVGLGVMYVLHGWPKLAGGAPAWTRLGHAMASVGISFFPLAWGLLASLSEFFGGALLVLGFLFRPACCFLAFNMFVAFMSVLHANRPFEEYSRPLEMLFVFILLAFVGPGKYSVDRG